MKKKHTVLSGKCPHCGGVIAVDQSTMDRIADVALDAVTRAAEKRVSTPDGVLMTFHLPPSATTTVR